MKKLIANVVFYGVIVLLVCIFVDVAGYGLWPGQPFSWLRVIKAAGFIVAMLGAALLTVWASINK